MLDGSIRLSAMEIKFLKEKFNTNDPDYAVECFVEMLVFEGVDPMQLKTYIIELMKKNAYC